jgi:hypothetical protein
MNEWSNATERDCSERFHYGSDLDPALVSYDTSVMENELTVAKSSVAKDVLCG